MCETEMRKINIITPVKDSIELTLETIKAITESDISIPCSYTVYNDFSTEENTAILEKQSEKLKFNLVNLSEITTNPSPNYLLVLQHSQSEAIEEDAGLLIIESDVIVKKDTIQKLFDGASKYNDCGIAASVTVDESGNINYPYLFAKGRENMVFPTKKHLSFCCSLLTLNFLKSFDFHQLNPEKSWHDVTISHQAIRHNFNNYLFTKLPVQHRPHSSRPWKQLKYSNPVKYYWLKLIHKRDKI